MIGETKLDLMNWLASAIAMAMVDGDQAQVRRRMMLVDASDELTAEDRQTVLAWAINKEMWAKQG